MKIGRSEQNFQTPSLLFFFFFLPQKCTEAQEEETLDQTISDISLSEKKVEQTFK